MKNIVIIRDRGQLTIPDTIRKSVHWTAPQSAVIITITKPEEIVIRPHRMKPDKEKIWSYVNRSRTNKGRGKLSTVEFLAKDRISH